MNRVAASLGFIAILFAPSAFLAGAQHFLGSWKVDVSKLPVPEPPASVTIRWENAEDGRLKMNVDIVDRRGALTHAESTFALDGTPARAVGSLDVDIVSMTMPSDRVLVMGAGVAGNPSNTRIFAISSDGRRMTETIVGHGPGGVPTTRVNNWLKQ